MSVIDKGERIISWVSSWVTFATMSNCSRPSAAIHISSYGDLGSQEPARYDISSARRRKLSFPLIHHANLFTCDN